MSFSQEELARDSAHYNYASNNTGMTELPGISVFFNDDEGGGFHTDSCYARGLDMMNTAYHYLDIVLKGRDEAAAPSDGLGAPP